MLNESPCSTTEKPRDRADDYVAQHNAIPEEIRASEAVNWPEQVPWFEPLMLLQWAFILLFLFVSILNFLEITPSLYYIFPISGRGLLLRAIFAAILSWLGSKAQWMPIVWWLPALICPVITYFYFVLFTHGQQLGKIVERYLDVGFFAMCIVSAIVRGWLYF